MAPLDAALTGLTLLQRYKCAVIQRSYTAPEGPGQLSITARCRLCRQYLQVRNTRNATCRSVCLTMPPLGLLMLRHVDLDRPSGVPAQLR